MATETAIDTAAMQLLTVELPELLGITGTVGTDVLEAVAAMLPRPTCSTARRPWCAPARRGAHPDQHPRRA